jgi:rod shape-determining protein MreD
MVFIVVAALFQSTILSSFVVYVHAVPDLALCILVYSAYLNGTMSGQLTGFFSGILLDFISASPLGLNALVRTLVGGLTGLFKDTFFLDILFLPMILCAGATLFKALVYFPLHLLFPNAVPVYMPGNITLWIELGLNTLLAPFLFGFLRLFRFLLVGQRENA